MTSNIDIEYIQKFMERHVKVCPVCRIHNTDGGSPSIICDNGAELIKLENKKIESNIKIEFRDLTLDKLVGTKLDKVLGQVSEYVKNYEVNIERGFGLFLCSETTGTGKSAVANGIAMEFLKRGKTAYCIGFDECIDKLSVGRLTQEEQRQFRNKILNVDLLILDDLGLAESLSPKQKDFVRNHFILLFKERCNNLKPVILTSNKRFDQLEELYGKQFMSVFYSRMTTIEFPAWDYRALVLNVGGYNL